jgi:catechol 2,3-dioxygenase-like lactoylglutathione lyase family enzyme
MTAHKDFKQLVRARVRRTGESYAAARQRLLASTSGLPGRQVPSREDTHAVKFNRVIPVLRMFDAGKAKEFYVAYLGMTVDWEHRFEPELPLYLQVSRGDLVLHLSEHHGDGTPGTVVYVDTTDVATLHAELRAKQYAQLNPGLDTDEIGTCLSVLDPFGNTLRFNQRSRS